MAKSSPTKIQAKHIPAEALIDTIHALSGAWRGYASGGDGSAQFFKPGSANIWAICEMWPTIPIKVIRAKLKKLIKAKQIDGCLCGCSGEFTVIEQPNPNKITVEWYDHDKDDFVIQVTERRSLSEVMEDRYRPQVDLSNVFQYLMQDMEASQHIFVEEKPEVPLFDFNEYVTRQESAGMVLKTTLRDRAMNFLRTNR